MDNIKFVRSDQYYYDVLNNTIYGKEKFSFSYYHELRHLLDHQNKIYCKLSIFLHQFVQFTLMMIPIYFLNTNILFFMLLIPHIFIVQEEVRADIYAIKMRRKNGYFKKRNL